MEFKRQAHKALEKWKNAEDRKPLILRGARQVGKTTLVRSFAKSYKHSILLNLEKAKDISFFQRYDNVQDITDALLLTYNIPTRDLTSTLLFIDEIQESPTAIGLLRYFYEEIPELHVIAAGSLLEFALQEVKYFPVGRIEYLYLHPLNFSEYLLASGFEQAYEQLHNIPVQSFSHQTLLDLFKVYAIIGGMPEIVKTYLKNKSLADLPAVYESIWTTYKSDVAKYTTHPTERKVVKHVMGVAHLYLDQRIKFQNFGNSNYQSREVSEAFRNLDDAKIIQLIYPTTDVQPPIIPDVKKSPRLQFLDTGIVNHDLKIQGDMLALDDLSTAYKGSIIPHLVTQELISLNNLSYHKPNFWIREKLQASSEVDLVYNYQNKVIPVEIKSGSYGKLRSLHQFIEHTNHPYAVRLYGGAFSIEKHSTPTMKKPFLLMNLPYYLGTKLEEYIAYFVEKY
jgi:uncharacterized protein